MLYKRGDIWHFRFMHEGHLHRGTTRQANKRKAEDIARRERDRVTLGLADQEAVSLTNAAESWWHHRGQYLKSAKTVAYRLETLRSCLSFTLDIATLSTGDIAGAMAKRRGQMTHNKRLPTPSTVNRDIIDTLRPILRHAKKVLGARIQEIDWGEVRLKEPRERVREFTQAEVQAVFDNLPEHYHDLVRFLGRYGVRLREAFFPLANFDRDEGRIFLRERKGGVPHTLPLLDEDRRLLAVKASRAESAGLSIVWFREDRSELWPLRPSSFQSAMRNAYRKAGIEGARPAHDWRHHAATQFTRQTGNLKATQRLLGHENIATTARYAHASERDVLDGLEMQSKSTELVTRRDKQRNNPMKSKAQSGT
jgi:integrase